MVKYREIIQVHNNSNYQKSTILCCKILLQHKLNKLHRKHPKRKRFVNFALNQPVLSFLSQLVACIVSDDSDVLFQHVQVVLEGQEACGLERLVQTEEFSGSLDQNLMATFWIFQNAFSPLPSTLQAQFNRDIARTQDPRQDAMVVQNVKETLYGLSVWSKI